MQTISNSNISLVPPLEPAAGSRNRASWRTSAIPSHRVVMLVITAARKQ
jgi:hypothetical protein